nr:NIF family HAD-type phosphatase [Marinobacterium rhizophilum]
MNLEVDSLGSDSDLIIIPRPGLIELFSELERYASPIIYTDMKVSDVDKVMSTLSNYYLGVDDSCNLETFSCDLDVFAWSLDQCVQTDKGPMKYLGYLSERCHVFINDLWIITDRPQLVDIRDRVVEVSSFFGDPNDKELLYLKDSLFEF